MKYPEPVLRHFFEPSNAGPLRVAAGEQLCRGEAGSVAAGAWVVMEAGVRESRVERLGFRAYGSPYLIAACSLATGKLAPGPVAALAGLDPVALARELDVPPDRLGSLLILQDALRNCFGAWDTTQPAGARSGIQ